MRGGEQSWPVGLIESAHFNYVALVEGAPDLLSVYAHLWGSGKEHSVAPVCMLSASADVPLKLRQYLRQKRVRIFLHTDEHGMAAGKRWHSQLKPFAGYIDGFDFTGLKQADGSRVKDLNDMLRCPDRKEWNAFSFAGEGGAK